MIVTYLPHTDDCKKSKVIGEAVHNYCIDSGITFIPVLRDASGVTFPAKTRVLVSHLSGFQQFMNMESGTPNPLPHLILINPPTLFSVSAKGSIPVFPSAQIIATSPQLAEGDVPIQAQDVLYVNVREAEIGKTIAIALARIVFNDAIPERGFNLGGTLNSTNTPQG